MIYFKSTIFIKHKFWIAIFFHLYIWYKKCVYGILHTLHGTGGYVISEKKRERNRYYVIDGKTAASRSNGSFGCKKDVLCIKCTLYSFILPKMDKKKKKENNVFVCEIAWGQFFGLNLLDPYPHHKRSFQSFSLFLLFLLLLLRNSRLPYIFEKKKLSSRWLNLQNKRCLLAVLDIKFRSLSFSLFAPNFRQPVCSAMKKKKKSWAVNNIYKRGKVSEVFLFLFLFCFALSISISYTGILE